MSPARQERDPADLLDALGALGDLSTAISTAISEATAALDNLSGALADAGLHGDRPPADPKARALWLRQHRNTGPRRGRRRSRR